MTGSAFMNRLRFRLDFLSEEDTATVLSFYQKKIEATSTLQEEEEIVRSFGNPEQIVEKLRECYAASQIAKAEESDSASVADENFEIEDIKGQNCPEGAEIAAPEEAVIEENDNRLPDEDELIFSKPPLLKKSPEIVHALDNPEIKPIYGEKVVLPGKDLFDDKKLEEQAEEAPKSEAYAPTSEEIEIAKAKTLEKAQKYNTASFGIPSEIAAGDEESPAVANEPLPKEDEEEAAKPEKEMIALDEVKPGDAIPQDAKPDEEKREYEGILNKIFATSSLPDGFIKFLKVLLILLFSPVILLVFVGILAAYGVCTLIMILLSVLFFLLMAGFLVGGVIELVYGIVKLFESVSVGLIEIGVGTVLFGIVCAVVGLIYEFLFGIVPKALKKMTRICKKGLARSRAAIFGGKA